MWIIKLFYVRTKLNNHILQYSDLKCTYEIKPLKIDCNILHSSNVISLIGGYKISSIKYIFIRNAPHHRVILFFCFREKYIWSLRLAKRKCVNGNKNGNAKIKNNNMNDDTRDNDTNQTVSLNN